MSKKEASAQARSLWDFPTEGIAVEAESYEDALAQLERIKSKPAAAIPAASEEIEK